MQQEIGFMGIILNMTALCRDIITIPNIQGEKNDKY